MGTMSWPSDWSWSSAAAQASAYPASPLNTGCAGTPMRRVSPQRAGPASKRLKGSAGSAPSITARIAAASSTVFAKMDTQSSVRQAGSTPAVLTRPGVGFRPTIWLKPAGTRPEPAVSVPSENGTSPRPTITAEPELEPPLTRSAARQLVGWP